MANRVADQAREAMRHAEQEARRFDHEYIGTEHILLGLVKEGSGVAANVLKNLGADLRKVRLEAEKIVQAGPGGDQVALGRLPHTPQAKKAFEYSVQEARGLDHDYLGTEHLLLGLLREQDGVAAQMLMNLGVGLDEVREEVRRELARPVIDPAWLCRNGSAAEQVARGIAEGRRWADLPVLADALQDAGCEDQAILGHLRLGAEHGCPPEHGVGCWVLDRLLARADRGPPAGGRPPKKWWQFWK